MKRHASPNGFACLCFLLAAVPAPAQHPLVEPPASFGDPSLRSIEAGFAIPLLRDLAGSSMDLWSSSFLGPEGEPPGKPPASGSAADWALEDDYSYRYASWACMYSAASLADDNPRTAWIEGVEGPGVGEVVIARVPAARGLGIRSGFQRSPELFARNARPRRVRVWLLAAASMDASELDEIYEDVRALASIEVELADRMGWQPLPLPSAHAEPTARPGRASDKAGRTAWFVAVQILSAYPGSRWEDCCISDIGMID